ncbi:alpha/beta hydrolase-fold protein [Plantactinospora sp. WMMB334]|uniref:alpha/beta hydrolase-fold protein n=1 Tax=Plantactinospora sp. WMMB334 TaxID=3404119 RepID=UPI003B957716
MKCVTSTIVTPRLRTSSISTAIWWNGGRYGPPAWGTFHLDEVRPILERGYGAGPRRAVAGASMGGYGALGYATPRPGIFRAVASYSGSVHLLHPDSVTGWRTAFQISRPVG